MSVTPTPDAIRVDALLTVNSVVTSGAEQRIENPFELSVKFELISDCSVAIKVSAEDWSYAVVCSLTPEATLEPVEVTVCVTVISGSPPRIKNVSETVFSKLELCVLEVILIGVGVTVFVKFADWVDTPPSIPTPTEAEMPEAIKLDDVSRSVAKAEEEVPKASRSAEAILAKGAKELNAVDDRGENPNI